MSSKYAELPDVDPSLPDVYETTSNPSPTQGAARSKRANDSDVSSGDEDDEDDDEAGEEGAKRRGSDAQEDNPHIERTKLNVNEAMEKFRASSEVNSKKADFSGAIPRRRKLKNVPRTLDGPLYELQPRGLRTNAPGRTGASAVEEETPLAKLRRLRFEADELERTLQASAEADGATWSTDDTAHDKGGEPSSAAMLAQLRSLRGDLAKMDAKAAGATTEDKDGAWAANARKLIAELQRSKAVDSAADAKLGAAGDRQAGSSHDVEIAGFESRIAELEELVGTRDLLDESAALPRPLLPSLARIEHLLTLLTHPRHLDAISRRVKVLVSELDRAHEARRKLGEAGKGAPGTAEGNESADAASALAPDASARLAQLFPILARIEPLIPLAPALLTRLQALAALHASASSFAADLTALDARRGAADERTAELKELLGSLKGSFTENEERLAKNFENVEGRIEALDERLKKLRA